MKNLIYFLLLGIPLYGQTGINTSNPRVTLDVTGKGGVSEAEGVTAPRLSKQQLANKTAGTYAAAQIGAIVYVNDAAAPTGTPSSLSQVTDVTNIGYYYFDGAAWKKMGDIADTNIYTNNGTLTGNRIVTQGANTLTFTGTATNAFSIDGSTLSVDAANHRVGVGSAAPSSILSVLAATAGGTTDALSVGINNCGTPCGQGTARNITLFNSNVTNTVFGGIDFIPSTSATGLSGASIFGIDRDVTNNYAGLQFFTRNATNYGPRMTVKSSGNVGVGTVNPNNYLHIAEPGQTSGITTSFVKGLTLTATGGGGGAGYAGPGFYFENLSNASGKKLFKVNFTSEGTEGILNFQNVSDNGSTSGGIVMAVSTSGKVGVGTTAPNGTLTVSKNGAGTTPALSLINTGVSGNPTLNIYPGFTSNGTTIAEGNQYAVVFDQDPGVSTISPTQSLYDFHGQIRSVNSSSLSDIRLKTDIKDLNEYGLKQVLQLQPKRYILKEYKTPDIGLIAQELKAVVPELVYGDESKGLLSVDYSKISLLLINAIKEQKNEIEELRKEIKLLKDHLLANEKK